VTDGKAELQLDFGGSIKTSSTSSAAARISDGKIHTVTVEFKYNKAIIGVDGQKVAEIKLSDDVYPIENLFIGVYE
jgi:hypothetical protein